MVMVREKRPQLGTRIVQSHLLIIQHLATLSFPKTPVHRNPKRHEVAAGVNYPCDMQAEPFKQANISTLVLSGRDVSGQGGYGGW